MSGQVISLNVGGTIFTTSVATLTKYPNSLLAAMFNPESERPPARKDDNGNFFIDGEPEPFKWILHFLRRGVLTEDIVGCTLGQLELEADYYGLADLLKLIRMRKDAEVKKKKAEEKKKKDDEKKEEERVRKRRIEEEEKERKRPKMTPLEYEEKAAELRIKWVESSQRAVEISKSNLCGCSDKCYAKPIAELSGYCKKLREATNFQYDLAIKLERKAEDLRFEGYDN